MALRALRAHLLFNFKNKINRGFFLLTNNKQKIYFQNFRKSNFDGGKVLKI